jgi:hypothetical protein
MEKSKFTWQEGESPQIFHWYHIKSDKSPVSHRHTLEGEVDSTTELVSGKSGGIIGGMRQEKPNLVDERIDNKQAKAISG